MTIKDFIAKERALLHNGEIRHACREATGDMWNKAMLAYGKQVKATPIWSADWDVCLVLDGCRADTFESVLSTRAGEREYLPPVDTRWSVGSASPEWIYETFRDRHRDHWQRAGYVTANPFSGKQGGEKQFVHPSVYPLRDRGLAHLDEVWRDGWQESTDVETVSPSDVTDRALSAWGRRDGLGMDRLVVHYMQPHIPFRRRDYWSPGWEGFDRFGTCGKLKGDWHQLRDGEIDPTEFRAAYEDNLRWVLNEVDRWRETTTADILVTSDHGNAKGEWGEWGHPLGSVNPALREVPWVRFDGVGDDSLARVADAAVSRQHGGETATDRLKALGYR